MSIAILTQVYEEMRRLAIAGSVVAGGDFRLQNLIPHLEKAGAQAPVFTRLAQVVTKVVEAREQTSAEALLELATLVNAILYTQGETGAAGTLEPIETAALEVPSAQASARVLKPLLEALANTGSGRLELIRDAHERGAFRDLRLVKPALEAIDDGYGEIADFMADKVLPLYGKAILPELRAKFNAKGRGGQARRLRLLQALDPAGTRELVKEALETGSKEVKVAAIECLGAEDLSYLLEQANARAQEVRQAAYRALAGIEDEAASAVLQKALASKDLKLVADSLRQSRNCKLLPFVMAEADRELAALPKTKDRKEVSQKIDRLQSLLSCLAGREDQASEAFLLKVFYQRGELAKIKGATLSGADLNITVIVLMEQGTRKLQLALAEAHASLPGENFGICFQAACQVLPPADVFAIFSPYLLAKGDDKKKSGDPARAKREALFEALGAHNEYYWSGEKDHGPSFDPRWLDVAVELKNLNLIWRFARPGHGGANAFLHETFQTVLKKSKNLPDCHEVLSCLVKVAHPQASDAFLAAWEKHGKKAAHFAYWFGRLIPELPKSALPRLEALLPNLPDNVADSWLGFLQQLRDRK